VTAEAHVAPSLPAPSPRHRRTGTALVGNSPWLPRFALIAIAALAGLSYAWALNRDPLEPYYAASVRSMSMSWHDFLFGAFDPAGTITLDKLPGAFWVQALAVRAFGVHTWAIVLPQAVEGVLTVLVLYRAVARLAGPVAGLIAAGVVAVSPATVALDRGNISDSLMILLVVLAADAVTSALVHGRQGMLVVAGVWVGLAFQAKMIEAWMLLPAFGLVYLLCGPGSTARRVRQLLVGAAVAAVVSLSWMTAVSLVPASHRPYVDGSHTDSVYEQVFVYNGFGRFGDQTPLQLLAGQSLGLGLNQKIPPAAPNRLLRGDFGLDTGWLLPAGLVVALGGIVSRRGRPRGDPLRACFVLWGVWLATLVAVFSWTTTINSYYTAALTPAAAALLGAGVSAVWSPERAGAGRSGAEGAGWPRRVALAVLVAGTVGYGAWLVDGAGDHAPGWLLPAVIVVGVVALGASLASVARRTDAFFALALAAGLLAGVLAPAVASGELVAQSKGAFDTPFESAQDAAYVDRVFVDTPAQIVPLIPRLEGLQNGAPYLLATQTSAVASVFIYASGLEALPIGGFTGTIPSPTLAQLKSDIRRGLFHLVLAAPSQDPRLRWIASHCLKAGKAASGLRNYYCMPADAG
jgi:4-amino-4-deoxy-L-arabinose transferase-like glycosyltransferase